MKADSVSVIAALLVVALWIAGAIGWFMNLFAVVGMAMDGYPMGSEFVLRIIGTVVFPVGGLLGWF